MQTRSMIAILIASLISAEAFGGDDWPQFRDDQYCLMVLLFLFNPVCS